jgi:hypothetical protein
MELKSRWELGLMLFLMSKNPTSKLSSSSSLCYCFRTLVISWLKGRKGLASPGLFTSTDSPVKRWRVPISFSFNREPLLPWLSLCDINFLLSSSLLLPVFFPFYTFLFVINRLLQYANVGGKIKDITTQLLSWLFYPVPTALAVAWGSAVSCGRELQLTNSHVEWVSGLGLGWAPGRYFIFTVPYLTREDEHKFRGKATCPYPPILQGYSTEVDLCWPK